MSNIAGLTGARRTHLWKDCWGLLLSSLREETVLLSQISREDDHVTVRNFHCSDKRIMSLSEVFIGSDRRIMSLSEIFIGSLRPRGDPAHSYV